MEHRWLGKRFENDWSVDKIREIQAEIASAVTIPVNVAVEAQHRVLSFKRMEELLRSASLIVLQECGCRSLRRNCDAPLDTCISLNSNAEESLKSGSGKSKKVTLEEALEALRRSHSAGLVHMAYTFKGREQPDIVCSCCSCCCHTLSGLIRFGLAKHLVACDTLAKTDFSLCTNCGICVERCQFGAREVVDGRVVHKTEQCFGCGLCVTTCPSGAIELVKKS